MEYVNGMYPSMSEFLPPKAIIFSRFAVVKNVVCRPTVRPCMSFHAVALSMDFHR
eukprot:SAG31_NODE_28228_length_413_cov_1.156051_1_plen_54_part_10